MADSPVILERRFVPKGATIMRQGDEATSAFLIQSGSVTVYTQGESDGEEEPRKVELAQLGVGQIFGEMALIFDEPRSATVEAREDCNLIIITRQALEYKLTRSDPTVKAIVQMLSRRVVSSNDFVMNKQDSLGELVDSIRMIYQNISSGLPENQQKALQAEVMPKMDEFLVAVRAFNARFGK